MAALATFRIPDPHTPAFSDPVIEGDTTVFQELQQAWQYANDLSGAEKCYVQTDRTLYQPGDTLWFNAFAVNAGDLRAATEHRRMSVSLQDPRGNVVHQLQLRTEAGTAAGEMNLSSNWPGGTYRLTACTFGVRGDTTATFRRDILLHKTVAPRIHLKLEFERKGLGPGDEVIGRFDATTIENQPLSRQALRYTADLGGSPHTSGTAVTDGAGRAYIRFKLPASLSSADGLLTIHIEHEGRAESITRPLPIVLNKIDLRFFPEGGDLIAGQPARMAFKAVNEFGKAADVAGYVTDANGRRVAEWSSLHNGMGSFTFEPAAGQQYTAHLTQPATARYALPAPLQTGATLQLHQRTADVLTFYAGSPRPGTFYLTGTSRDKIFFFKEIKMQAKDQLIPVPIGDLPIGIARFTLLDAQKSPLAERLVFLHRDRSLRIQAEANEEHYNPRAPVRLRLRVRDDRGYPVQGHFSLSVTDETLLTYADDKQGHLLSALLLEQDVKGTIEEPGFYFDTAEPKSEAALDVLLLTQGWRRFGWKQVLHKDVARKKAERTAVQCISGTFYNTESVPAAGRSLYLLPDSVKTVTDSTGHFSFKVPRSNRQRYLKDALHRTYLLADTANVCVLESVAHTFGKCTGQWSVIYGKVTDKSTGEALIGATVTFVQDKQLKRGTVADMEGNYQVLLPSGTYEAHISYTGYSSHTIAQVKVQPNAPTLLSVEMESGTALYETVVISSKVPLVRRDQASTAQVLVADDVKKLPTRSVNATVATAAGIDEGEIKIKGARSNGTNYYIDGIAVQRVFPPVAEDEAAFPAGLPADKADFEAQDEALMDTEEVIASDIQARAKSMPLAKRRRMEGDMSVPMSVGNSPIKPVATFHKARQFYVPKYQRTDPPPARRTDFRPTIYWNPAVTTDAFGEAVVDFVTSDAITNYRVTVEGMGNGGQPGRTEYHLHTRKPLSIEAKIPPYVITGDTLRLAALVVNKTGRTLSGTLTAQVPAHFKPVGVEEQGRTFVYRIERPAGPSEEEVTLSWRENGAVLDALKMRIPTLDRGFPVRQVLSGKSAQNSFRLSLMQPIEGSIEATLTACPGVLEEVLQGAERMLGQPSGCFEQVSSSNYPNLLVLDLLRRTGRNAPDIEKRAMDYLSSGYSQLTGYECKKGGFDWWGRDPAHEGLTAYGLLEFRDMQRVFPVDAALIDRTAQWLRTRRDGKGGWQVNPQSLHGWQNDAILDAYIAWGVASAGYGRDFAAEINAAAETAWRSDDPYQLALLANALAPAKDPRTARFTKRLTELQTEEGHWTSKTHSVFHATGPCFQVEIAALSALAFMQTKTHPQALSRAMNFIARSKTPYGYGSTQSTVLALKALTAFADYSVEAKGESILVVQVDGRRVQETAVSTKMLQNIKIPHLEQYFANDHPHIEVFFEKGKAVLPFDIEIKYASRQPRNTPGAPLALHTTLSRPAMERGEVVRLTAVLENTTAAPLASPMLVVGIPAGLSLQPWQLKKLVDEKQCDFYEIWDGKAVFHFEQLPAGERRTLALDLRADVGGAFEAPASEAFLYYDNDQRVWSKPGRIVVQ